VVLFNNWSGFAMNHPEQFWRYSFMGILLSVLPFLIIAQVVRIQLNPELLKRVNEQGWGWEIRTITPARGQLFDRWGNIMAANKTVYEVGIELRRVRNPQTIAQTLSDILGLDYTTVYGAASLKASPTAVYAVVADYVSQEQVNKIETRIQQMEDIFGSSQEENAPSLRGVVFYPHLARIYPEGTLASNILGFVSRNGTGYFGVEGQFNDLLAGKSVKLRVPLNPELAQELPTVPDGASLILTIDREIQRSMEDLLDASIDESGSKSGTIVVMKPKTGEVLALATTPRLNLNEYWRYPEIFTKDTPFNRGVSQAYEPGSVYKVLTMASALDSGAVKPETVFVDTGTIVVGGTPIYNWNMGAWGPQDMIGCLQHSLNVCLAWVATQMGTDVFYRYMQGFGIGRLTGIDMAGESTGRLKIPGDGDWYPTDLGTNAFGQGVAATPIQMAAAISAVANDGKMMAPHVVRSLIIEGHQHDIEQRVVGMPIRSDTARLLTEMLAESLEVESSDALVTGYRVAGKTGTAEIPTPFGYTTNATNASFVGWGPADDPQFLVYVWLERPQSSPWGSIVAAPVFRQAVERLVVLLNIPPDDIRHKLNSK
jgi:cell division protein FtsI/penicillin-binding protein 2